MNVPKPSSFLTAFITVFILLGMPFSRSFAEPASENNALLQQIDEYVRKEISEANIPGLSVGIIQGDETLLLRSYGTAGPDDQPMTPQTPMLLGSTSKAFTAMAVMQLVEQGLIDLDSPIGRYLPEFETSDPELTSRIKVRHLLNQTSGLTEADGRKDLAEQEDIPLRERNLRYGKVTLAAAPGEQFEYSNINYSLLGWLVETVTGDSLNHYFQRHIFIPLNMNNSFTSYESAKEHGLAAGHRVWFGRPLPTSTNYLSHDVATGYVISSAEDMTKYLKAHIKAGAEAAPILSKSGFAQLFQPGGRESDAVGYGMGWYINLGSGSKWHHGDLEHFHSAMIILNKDGASWGIVLLANANSYFSLAPMLYQMSNNITEMIKGEPVEPVGESMKSSQNVMNVVLLILVLAALVQFWVDYRIRNKPKASGKSLFKLAGFPLLLKGFVIWFILQLLPELAGAPLSVIMLYQPDLGYILMIIAGITLLAALLHLWGCYKIRSRARKNTLDAKPHNL